jgi:hypothetical protein
MEAWVSKDESSEASLNLSTEESVPVLVPRFCILIYTSICVSCDNWSVAVQ